jgi:phosphate-selective porin OprO/OprP
MFGKEKLRALSGAAILGAAAAFSGSAAAANDAMMDLLKLLKDKGSLTQDEYELLKAAAKADDEQVEGRVNEVKTVAAQMPKVETKDKLTIGSQDGDFQWQPIGRIMADYNWVDSDESKLASGAEFRRARLGMQGVLWKHWIWKAEFDFADATVASKDLYVGYQGDTSWGKYNAKMGQQHVPFGLSTMSSSKYMLFTERPLMSDTVLQPARQLGASIFATNAKNWTFHAGAFAGPEENPNNCLLTVFSAPTPPSNTFTTFDECDEQFNIAARGTFDPYVQDATHLLHVGAAILYKDPQDSALRVRQRPGSIHTLDTRFVDADFKQGADDVTAFNVEAAAIWGPFNLQGEYTHWDVNRQPSDGSPVGAPNPADVSLDGYYVEGGFFLTGESMVWKPEEAQYGGMKPLGIVGKGGYGAWQVALRYEVLDLNDSSAGMIGGKEEDFRVGVNWYVNNTMRFMLDYTDVLSLDKPGSSKDNDEPSAVTIRSQVYW